MDRIQKLKRYLMEQNVDAFLIESEVNRFYFTDYRCNLGAFLLTKTEFILIVDSRFYKAAKHIAKDCEVIEAGDKDRFITNFCREKRLNRIMTEEMGITARRWRELSLLLGDRILGGSLLDDFIYKLRRRKDQRELGYLRKAQEIADHTFLHMLDCITPGMTETEIKMELGLHMVRLGSENHGMNFLVATGPNSAYPHGGGRNREIASGDFVTMDFGGQIHGYSADMTRTIAVGKISEKQRQVYEIVKIAQQKAMEKLAPGKACIEIDRLARDYIEQKGYGTYFSHGLGHSLGLEIHENPRCNEISLDYLEEDMMMTIEPGIYIPSEFGVRIEDMVLITEDGYENMTTSTHELMVID